MSPLLRLLNWWNGWRTDYDGWLVRAGRQGDPATGSLEGYGVRGFVSGHGAVYVGEPEEARAIDRIARIRVRLDRREG